MELVTVNNNFVKENGNQYNLLHFGIMIKQREDFDKLSNNLKSLKDIVDVMRKK